MVDKKHIKHRLNELRKIKTWQLVILFILACFVAATFLRLNNIAMVERRSAVSEADKGGDAKSIQERLYDLQRYVSGHMNTDLGKGVYLEYSYKRDIQKAYVEAENNPTSGNIYKKAQEVCAPQFTHWSEAYVQCTYNELSKYPASSQLIDNVQIPRANVYLHDYVSPIWSPDFAGFSVLICVVILIILISRFIGVLILRIMLQRRYKSI